MTAADLARLVLESLAAQRLRSGLTALGVVIGIAAVVLLSSIGEGTRQGVVATFSQFGTTLVGVRAGKSKTLGGGSMLGTTHKLTIEDALALRRVPGVRTVAPHAMGMAEVDSGERRRRTYVYGTTKEDQEALQWRVRTGSFLPAGDPDAMPAVCVLGAKVAREVFPGRSPLGARVKLGEARFTVIGVMAEKGQILGFDLDDMVVVPVVRAMRLFDLDQVDEIHVLVANHDAIEPASAGVRALLRERHDGEDDVTVTSQADLLKLVGEVFSVLTTGVLVIATISVVVGAIGVLTISWVSVHERTAEVGLLKAIGASDAQVRLIFLSEAAVLSLLGGGAGVLVGLGLGRLIELAFPAVAVEVAAWTIPLALAASVGVGLLAGVLPAARAARLDPLEALRAE